MDVENEKTEDDPIACSECCVEIDPDDIVTGPDSKDRCQDCHSEAFPQCENCGRSTPSDEIETIDGYPYCVRCADREFLTCEECGDRIRSECDHGGSNSVLCEECYDRGYFTCDGCDGVMPNDRYVCDGLCEECYRDDGDSEDWPIREWDDRTASTLGPFGKPTEGYFLGVELEVEISGGRERADVARVCLDRLGETFAVTKHDGSLNHGFEIVTAPATVEHHSDRWKRLLLNRPNGMRSWDTGTCGMHVHISRKPLGKLTVGKIVKFVNDPNNQKFVEMVAGRSTHFARIDPSKARATAGREPSEKYSAVNTSHSRTIELRIFKGTLRYEGVMKNLEFCCALVSLARNSGTNDLSEADFLRHVSKTPKRWPHLAAWLRERDLILRPTTKRPATVTSA